MVTIRAAAGGITEGDYTSWTLKWIWTVPYSVVSPAYYMDEINDVLYLWMETNSYKHVFGTYRLSDHTTLFQSVGGTKYTVLGPDLSKTEDQTFFMDNHFLHASILRSHQTYILLLRYDAGNDHRILEVWRAGSKIWSRDVQNDNGELYANVSSGSISLTGKYILVFEHYSWKLLLYEGA